jgi:hypothetical protein
VNAKMEAIRDASTNRITENAVASIVRAAGGTEVEYILIGSRPESDARIRMPEPLMAALAARHLRWAAARAEHQYIRYAREDGATWQEIGEALCGTPSSDTGMTAAEAIFRYLTTDGSRYGDDPVFRWTCRTCRQWISDHGPETGHPADAERGHADGCERLTTIVAEYESRWADE